MEIAVKQTFTLTVDIAELRLISRGLRQQLRPEDAETAAELDRQIATARVSHAEAQYREMMKLRENLS